MATHTSVLAWRIPGTGGALWAAVYGVAQSWTRLKQLSSSSSSSSLVSGLLGVLYLFDHLRFWFCTRILATSLVRGVCP